MFQPSAIQFQATKGPGYNFRTAPTSHVKIFVFRIESANTVANPHLLPSFSMATDSPLLSNDMDVSCDNLTMTQLLAANSKSRNPRQKQTPITVTMTQMIVTTIQMNPWTKMAKELQMPSLQRPLQQVSLMPSQSVASHC